MSNEIKPPNIDSVNKSSIPRKPFRLRQTIAKISNSKAVKCQSSIQLKAGSVRDNSGVCAVADSESDKTCIFEKSKYSEELEMSGRKPSVGDRRSVESLGILSPNQMEDFSWIDDGSDPGSSRPRFRLGQELVLATWLQSPSNQQSASRVNPDRRSVESLGILTPNQIKDFSWINSTPKPIFEETPPDLLNFCTPGTKATRMSFSPKKIKIDKSMNATFSKDTKAKLENTYSIDSNSTIDRKIAQRSVASNTVVLADETEILLDNTYSLEAGVSDQKNVQCGVLECVENQLDSTYDLGLVNQDRDSLEGSAAKDLKPESITEEILNNTYGLLTTPADSARKKVQSSVVKGSVIPPSVVTSVTSLGSMDGYQGDVEGTGTQNTPVRLHPKKSKSGPSSEMETSGIFSDVELVNDDPESSKNRTVIRTAPQSDKSKLVSKTPSSRSSASSSLCSVATKISAKSPRLQNTKDIKDAANRSRKLPLPQTKVPLRKSTMPEIKPPTKARSISLSTKPPAAQLIPPVIPPRESPSRISYQRPPKPAPKPAKSIESEKLPNRRPGPYANGRQSMLPSARQGKSIVPVANSTPEGDAATGRLRRKTVFALGNTRKNETTFGSKPPSPIQKVLSNPPSSVQWKPQIQEHPPKKTQEVMKLENVVESLREELKRANLQKEDFCRLEKQNDELLQAIKALKDELDERKSELASKVSELNILHTEMDKLQEINRNLIKSIEAQNEAEEKFREQETELKNYYAEELKRTTSVYTAEIEKEKRENKSLMLKLKDNQGLVEELKRTLLLPVDTRYEAQIEKQSAEISSLHTVLAMRNEELKDCRAVARELQLQQEELLTLRDRLQKTELAKEDLFVRLQMEREEKRRCEQKIETLTIQLRSDSNKLKRVSMDKEQLEYRLSSAGLDVCGSPLARNNSNSTFSFNVSSPNLSSSTVCTSPKPQTNGTSDRQSLSPVPQSPGVMRRVVEKSESLSYVLGFEEEIDDMIVELRSPKKSV